MKRALFHYPVFNTGGAEMSSLRMMKALTDRGWEITLVLTTGGGSLEASIDPRIRVVRLRPKAFGNRFVHSRSAMARLLALPDLLAYGLMRSVGILRMFPFLFCRYNAAAVLLMGTPSFFIRRIVQARVRIQWIRNDLSGADPGGSIATALQRAAPDLDQFICVSQVSLSSLVAAVPAAAGKAKVIYNILDSDAMRDKARIATAPFSQSQDGIVSILTVCRLNDRAKGLQRMVSVCRRLADRGFRFVWYVAGDGIDRGLLETTIVEAGQEGRMLLLGNLKNPFPAYAAADLVAMLSYYEGLCGVINEARVLMRPVIATRVSGIDEQLTDGVNGLIVDNDEDAIFEGMSRLLSDPKLCDRLAVGGYPMSLLNDEAKLDELEALFLAKG
ncbi:MAG: glycosyltransferase [Pseudomonadales bacterium]|nr:glycosyltransferase [Pseudomonadales bacterium]